MIIYEPSPVFQRREWWQKFDTIRPVQAFRVGSRVYLTPKAAAKKIAWSMIFNKYSPYTKANIQDIKKVYRYECECTEEDIDPSDGEPGQYRHEECELHNRDNGYFKRLHARLVRVLLAIYAAQPPAP